jgi:hypothetical protein
MKWSIEARPLVLFALWLPGLLAGPRLDAGELSPPIPLSAGTRWVYEAEVQWVGVGETGLVHSNHFRFTNDVVASFQREARQAAVVRGFPNDIGGMDPVVPRNYSVLLWADSKLYRFPYDDSRRKAVKAARAWLAAPASAIEQREPLLVCPLMVGRRWASIAVGDRDDGWYAWHVESVTNAPSGIKALGAAARSEAFTVAYRTCPSHELMVVVPGVGVTRYEFEHHGTPGEERVNLLEFRPARDAKPPH